MVNTGKDQTFYFGELYVDYTTNRSRYDVAQSLMQTSFLLDYNKVVFLPRRHR